MLAARAFLEYTVPVSCPLYYFKSPTERGLARARGCIRALNSPFVLLRANARPSSTKPFSYEIALHNISAILHEVARYQISRDNKLKKRTLFAHPGQLPKV